MNTLGWLQERSIDTSLYKEVTLVMQCHKEVLTRLGSTDRFKLHQTSRTKMFLVIGANMLRIGLLVLHMKCACNISLDILVMCQELSVRISFRNLMRNAHPQQLEKDIQKGMMYLLQSDISHRIDKNLILKISEDSVKTICLINISWKPRVETLKRLWWLHKTYQWRVFKTKVIFLM